MAGPFDLRGHVAIGHRQRPDPVVDAARHLLDRAAIGRDRVPHAHEVDGLDFDPPSGLQSARSPPQRRDCVAEETKRLHDEPHRHVEAAPIDTVRRQGITGELRLAAVAGDQAHARDHPRDDADGEGAAAEAKAEDAVARAVVPAGVAIEVEHVALEAEAEDAAEHGQRAERRRSHSVVVVRDLPARITEIERSVDPPDIGLEQLRRAVAGAIRQQDDVLCHACSSCPDG